MKHQTAEAIWNEFRPTLDNDLTEAQIAEHKRCFFSGMKAALCELHEYAQEGAERCAELTNVFNREVSHTLFVIVATECSDSDLIH